MVGVGVVGGSKFGSFFYGGCGGRLMCRVRLGFFFCFFLLVVFVVVGVGMCLCDGIGFACWCWMYELMWILKVEKMMVASYVGYGSELLFAIMYYFHGKLLK